MEILILGLYSLLNDEHIKNYLKEANNNSDHIKYAFINPIKCKTGARNKTYVFAPTGKVFLKQISKAGKVGRVCE